MSTATGIHEQKYPLLIILCTSSWTSRTVSAVLAREALSAVNASISKSFLSSSSPSLFFTRTSLISTLSSSCRPAECPFNWVSLPSTPPWVDSSDRVRDNEAEHKRCDFPTNNLSSRFGNDSDRIDWSERLSVSDAEHERDGAFDHEGGNFGRSKSNRVLNESMSWANEFVVLVNRRGMSKGRCGGRGLGTLREEQEVTQTSSLGGIVVVVAENLSATGTILTF